MSAVLHLECAGCCFAGSVQIVNGIANDKDAEALRLRGTRRITNPPSKRIFDRRVNIPIVEGMVTRSEAVAGHLLCCVLAVAAVIEFCTKELQEHK